MAKSRKRKAHEVLLTTSSPKKRHQELEEAKTTAISVRPVKALFAEEPRGTELKREVELYEKLGSENEIERLQAANTVLSGLLSGEGVSEAVLTRHLERRLLRGLASGRNAARLGFSVALTEILSQLFGEADLVGTKYAGLGFDWAIETLRTKTKPEGDLSGQEEKDHAFGLIFGLQCFVRAKVLFTTEGEENRWEKVLDGLLQLAEEKKWLRRECGWVIVEAVGQMEQKQAEKTLHKLHETNLAASPEGVGIWLTARRKFPGMIFPSRPWGQNGNPLEHLSSLAKALKESSNVAGQQHVNNRADTGSWRPQLHFAWDIVLHEYISPMPATDRDLPAARFPEFWRIAVDESLFSDSASSERKSWGFLIFSKALNDVAQRPWMLDVIFSQNFMRCLINHISHEDRFLHRAAERCIKRLVQEVGANCEIVTRVLPQLISHDGVYNFDQVSKTKTVDSLLSYIEGDRNHEIIIYKLLSPVKTIKTTDNHKDVETRRQMFGDYILTMIRRVNIADSTKDNGWVGEIALPLLGSLAFSKDETYVPPISEMTRTVFKNRLNSAFAHLISDSNGFTYPCMLLQALNPSAVDMDEQLSTAKDRALQIMEKLLKKYTKATEENRKPIQALAMLYSLVIFQLYNGESDAVSLLDEIKLCYDKLIRGKGVMGSDSEASVVLIEILLSFMSRQSMLFRKIAQQVFAAFSGDFTKESLKLLVNVLESSETLKGQHDLFDQDGDEAESDSLDPELGSDVELLEVGGVNGHEESDAAGVDDDENYTDEDEYEEDEVDDDDEEEARKLDAALAKALGTHRADQDLKEESSDSDADMSDSEMMALDSKLVEIFSQRKKQPSKKQEKKDARENIIYFKSRVLDLVEIYVKTQAANSQAFELLLPLLKLTRTTSAKHVSERAHNIIASFAKASKGLKPEGNTAAFDQKRRLQILEKIHEEALKDQSHSFARTASTASLLVATNLYRADKANFEKIGLTYLHSQISCVERDVKIQASFFHDWVNWWQSHLS